MKQPAKVALVAAILLGVGATAWIVTAICAYHSFSRQITNLAIGRSIAEELSRYYGEHHRYPEDLRILEVWADGHRLRWLDAWGHPFHYKTNGRSFVHVSLGDDGELEYRFPEKYRSSCLTTSAPIPVWSICGNPAADQVMSDLGEHRICGK